MKTGLPCRLASENGLASSVGPVIAAAANVWKPDGGTVTCVLSILDTASCLLNP